MPRVRFTPSGFLDVASDPGEQPTQDGSVSGNMTRCTNLVLDRDGIAKTRDGSTKINASAIDTPIHLLVEQGGVRYSFAGTKIYRNESQIASGLTSAIWTGVKYNAYNVTEQSIFAVNGTDRKRVTGTTVAEWGIAPPTTAPGVTSELTGFAYTHAWEVEYTALAAGAPDYGAESCVLYIPFDDGTGNGDVVDYATGKTVTINGSSAVTDDNPKYGSHSLRDYDTEGYLSLSTHADFDFSAGIFTIAAWRYVATSPASYSDLIYHHYDSDTSFMTLRINYVAATNTWLYYFTMANGADTVLLSSPSYNTSGVWQHVQVVENGDTFYLFIDGVLVDSDTSAARGAAYSADLLLSYPGTLLRRNVDEIIVWNGVAKNTASFSPPSAAYRTILASESANPSFRFGQIDDAYQFIYDWEAYQIDGLGGPADSVSQRWIWFWEAQTGYAVTNRFGVKYTYVRKSSGGVVESESNPSDASYIESGSGLIITWTVPTDPQVTHVRIYRTLAGGETYLYSDEYAADLGQGTFTKDDLELGDAVEIDHTRPPSGGTIVVGPDFNGVLFMVVNNLLYFSKAQQPEYWPPTQYVEVSTLQNPIQSVRMFNGQVFCMTMNDVVQILGTGSQSFSPVRQSAVTGAVAQEGALGLKGHGLLRVANDGVWQYNGAVDQNASNVRFRPVFEGDTAGSIPGINSAKKGNSWMVVWRGRVYHGFPSGAYNYPTEILRTELGTGKVVHFNFNNTEFSCVVLDETNDRLLAGDSNGFIWVLEDSSATDDGGTAIAFQVESMEFTQLYKVFPRYAKWDVALGTGAAANGRIVLDGTIKQSHTLADRITRKRNIGPANGDRLSLRIDGTGPVTIYSAEVM